MTTSHLPSKTLLRFTGYTLVGGLDLYSRLFKFKLTLSPVCPFCRQEDEAAKHIFKEIVITGLSFVGVLRISCTIIRLVPTYGPQVFYTVDGFPLIYGYLSMTKLIT